MHTLSYVLLADVLPQFEQAVLDVGRVQGGQGELHLTGVLRGDIQHDPLSKKVLVVCFVVLFVVCFVCCGFGAFLSKKQEAKQAKQGSKKAKQAKQGGRRKTEGEQKHVVCKSVAFKSVSCSKILECMTPSPFPFSLSLSRL